VGAGITGFLFYRGVGLLAESPPTLFAHRNQVIRGIPTVLTADHADTARAFSTMLAS
jgi:hypothetical protein